MAKGTVTQRLNIYIDNTEAERALDKLRSRATKLETEIDDINRAGGNATKSMQRLASTKSQIKNLETSIKTGVNRSLRDMQGELRRVSRELDRATDPADIDRLNKRWQALKTETDQYRKALYKVNQEKKGLKGFFGGIGGNLKGALFFGGVAGAITAATGALIRFGQQAFQVALQAEGVRRAFDRLDRPGLLSDLRKATRGTVSDLELMKRAVAASNFRIPLEKLGLYLKFAQQRARDTGQSVDYLVESIITGLGRQSPLILDNLGISLAEIRKEMQKGATVAEAVGNIIERSFEKTGKVADTTADKLGRISARWENLKLVFGDGLVFLTNKADSLKNVLEPIARFLSAMSTPAAILVALADKAAGKNSGKNSEEKLKATQKFIDTAFKNTPIGIINSINKLDQFQQSAKDTTETLKGLKTELSLLEKQLETLPIKSKKYTSTQKRIEELKAQIVAAGGTKTQETATNKILSDQKKLAADLEKINRDLSHFFDNEIEARLYAIQQKYEKEKKLAHDNAELIKQIEETKAREIALIHQQSIQKINNIIQKARITSPPEEEKRHMVGPGAAQSKFFNNNTGKPGLSPQQQKLLNTTNSIQKYFDQARDAYVLFDQFLNNREQQELAHENLVYNKKLNNLNRQLRLKVITQQQYNKKVGALEEDLDKKRYELQKKQFRRQKEIQIAQTIANGAAAAVRLWLDPGFPAAIPLFAVVSALTATKVALIAAQKPPKYGRGGALDGPKHSSPSKGMPVTNPNTGHVQAYLEGGEGILKAAAMDDRRIYRVTGTPSQIASVLNASHGGVNWESGATLQPTWMQQAYRPINYDRIQPSLRRFAEGGRFDQSSTASAQSPEISEQMALMKEQNDLLRQQVALLAMPTRAVVSLHDINTEQARLQWIQEDATMRR